MMRRLRDERETSEPLLSEAARLLAEVRPLAPSEARKRRVWASLDRPGRRRLWRPGWAVAAALLGLTAVAGATIGRATIGRWLGVGAPTVEQQLPAERAMEPRRHAATPPPVSATPALPEPALVEPPIEPPRTAVAPRPRPPAPVAVVAAQPAVPPEPPAVEPSPPDEERVKVGEVAKAPPDEAAEILDALRALRRDGDPGRASRLLTAYLAAHPEGALAEEALALAIEAAGRLGDGRAATLGAEYLRRYPRGRFAALAREAAARRAP